MAVVPDPRWRVLDASGNAVVGATLTIYTAGTTNPATVYSDAGLTVPITLTGINASDAQGYFPQWFATDGALFDILVKDSGGSTITDRSYVSVPAVGADTSSLLRDFTGSRLRIANLAGTVRVEGGPASGDDTGGNITIGGYDGTQADNLTLDGANIDTTAVLHEVGKKLIGAVATDKTTFAAAASVVIALPNSPTGVLAWDVDIFGLYCASTLKLSVTVSTDNGATYLSAGYIGTLLEFSGATVTGVASSTSKWDLTSTSNFDSTAAPTSAATLRIVQANTAAGQIVMNGQICGPTGSGLITSSISACRITASARITHIKLTPSASTITGSYRVTPLRGFGD